MMETKLIKCKVWVEDFQGSEVLCIMSPRLKTLRILPGSLGIDALNSSDAAEWSRILSQAEFAVYERHQWESGKERELRRLADAKEEDVDCRSS